MWNSVSDFKEHIWEIVSTLDSGNDFVPLMNSVSSGGFVRDELSEKVAEMDHSDVIANAKLLEAERIERELREQIFDEGYQKGLEAGRQEMKAELEAEYQPRVQRIERLMEEQVEKWKEIVSRAEIEALNLSLEVARKILATTVEVKPDYVADVIRAGIQTLKGAKPIRIKVSEQDYEFIQVVGLPTELSSQELGVSYVADSSIKDGCIIETDFGDVHLEIDQMWQQVRDSIYNAYR